MDGEKAAAGPRPHSDGTTPPAPTSRTPGTLPTSPPTSDRPANSQPPTSPPEADEIAAAKDAGQLDRILGVPDHEIQLKALARTGRLTPDDARTLGRLGHHELLSAAWREGRVDVPGGDQ